MHYIFFFNISRLYQTFFCSIIYIFLNGNSDCFISTPLYSNTSSRVLTPFLCATITQHSVVDSIGISYPNSLASLFPPKISSLKTGLRNIVRHCMCQVKHNWRSVGWKKSIERTANTTCNQAVFQCWFHRNAIVKKQKIYTQTNSSLGSCQNWT